MKRLTVVEYYGGMGIEENGKLNLHDYARRAMLSEEFLIDFPRQISAEIKGAAKNSLVAEQSENIKDLRHLLWSSIDNEDSRDLDQIEVVNRLEGENIQVLVGIADVDAFVPQDSAADIFAAKNTTSVYTGVNTFPMLPREFSEDLTSLQEGEERLAIVIDFTVAGDGSVKLNNIYRAIVINQARLDYDSVGNWLDGKGQIAAKGVNQTNLEEQLRLQDQVADRLRMVRERAGALEFGTVEATTEKRDGEVYEVVVKQKNQARYLIENLMITSNVLMSEFLKSKNYPRLERVVRRPERWQRIVELAANFGEKLSFEPDSKSLAEFLEKRRKADPLHFPDLSLSVVKLIGSGDYTAVPPGDKSEGHFGLAVNGYTHSTAPNRRYADLITQRLVKAAINSGAAETPPYNLEELAQIAERCNERQSAERKVERLMRKVVAAQVLSRRIGEHFEGIITGVSGKGTFVRLITPPAEGLVVRGAEGLDVGDRITVKLINTNPARGFIDFERLSESRVED
ncbi:MAG: RNB domain-containing ribonuclease [Pyrinomonadaceae bacterium]